jgi:ABC-2 type transport system ATP-binding protein
MKKTIKKFIIASTVAAVVCAPLSLKEANAAGEKVYFGSDVYEWDMDQTWFLGTYAVADDELDAVDYIVTYDPYMMEFVQGGDLIEPGKVQVSAEEIEDTEFKRMMDFTPLIAGNTEITITEAQVASNGGQAVQPDSVSVPVSILIPSGCRLSGITLNGTEIRNFDGDITDYTVDLESYAEHAEIELQPEDISAEITGTELAAGENIIYITTTNTDGAHARYTVRVNCPEQPIVTEPVSEDMNTQVTENEQDAEEASVEDEQDLAFILKLMAVNHPELLIAFAALIIVFIILIITKVCIHHKRKSTSVRKKQQIEDVQENDKGKDSENDKENEIENDNDIIRILESPWEENIELREPDKKIEQRKTDLEKAAKDKMIFEISALTEEDLQEASDYLEEDETVIEVDHVTIDFKREKDESSSIKELVIHTLTGKRTVQKFRALDDVSFKVMKGEVVGVIGTNGSGKSTILKIISGVLAPTEGFVKVDKQKIQLLTLGTGFDMELTGRENVYLNGAIIGYTKEYIDEKYDDIVKFAELEGFMEEKVKNYSSGMVSRLGFAIATIRNTPEILILDEVLSVGDMFFRKKSEKRIQEMIHGGSTVLIVSHSTSVIRKNCTKVVWIEKGKLKAVGDPGEVCAAYEKMSQA